MGESHEVVLEWWGDGTEWRTAALEPRWTRTFVDLDQEPPPVRHGPKNPAHRSDDRLTFWRYDSTSGVLAVRVPCGDRVRVLGGVWIEKSFRLTEDRRIIPTGRGEVVNLDGGDPLSNEVLTALGLRGLNAQLERNLRVVPARLGLPDAWVTASAEVRRPGRRGMTDSELAQWAQRYVDARAEEPRRPYAALTRRYPGWSDAGLKSIVRRARKAGLLTEVGQGETGGDLTQKAKEILDGEH